MRVTTQILKTTEENSRLIKGLAKDINAGKKIPVTDNFIAKGKNIGQVVPGSARIVEDSLVCDVEIDEALPLDPVYQVSPPELLAMEVRSCSMSIRKNT